MFNISSFLEKFSKNISTQESQIKKICDVILEQTGLVLNPQKIKIQNNILYLQISPAQKNKIFICKQKILEELEKVSQIKIVDIR
jgi:hypothetical protein